VREVPNRGRDIGPLLTEFGAALREYDVFGHLHTKKTLHALAIGKDWYEFLLENLLGGEAPMMDAVLDRMAADPRIGIAFPDDPNVNGWDKNLPYVEKYLAKLGIEQPPREFAFPIGTMFWARPAAVEPLLNLGLGWDDYPQEPLPIDGTMLHGLERLFGVVAARSGYRVVLTHVPGRTR
jgi:lipopolysaccharide biosynthesis protein